MRVVFLGSDSFAVPTLATLVGSEVDVSLVITQPDRPAGRGSKIRQTPVKEAAVEMGIPVYQPPGLKDREVNACLEKEKPDLCVIVAYGHKVPPGMLDIPRYGFINAHASILPKYRGAAPVPHAILNGESETGVTVFQLAEEWDDGPVYGTVTTPIRSTDTSASLLNRMSVLAGELVLRVVRDIASGKAAPVPQEHAGATRAPKMTREDGLVDWSSPSDDIDRLVRAFQPWPEAFTFLPPKRGKQKRLHILTLQHEPQFDLAAHSAIPGEILAADGRLGLIVAAGDGLAVRLARVKPEGKRAMDGAEFVRGANLEKGMVLGKLDGQKA